MPRLALTRDGSLQAVARGDQRCLSFTVSFAEAGVVAGAVALALRSNFALPRAASALSSARFALPSLTLSCVFRPPASLTTREVIFCVLTFAPLAAICSLPDSLRVQMWLHVALTITMPFFHSLCRRTDARLSFSAGCEPPADGPDPATPPAATVQERAAGLASTLPTASVARTWNVCAPGATPV